jgi:hypothetical protein
MCSVKHDADSQSYGDCARACVASLLGLSADDVPHFYEDGTADGFERMRDWLKARDYNLFLTYFPTDQVTLDDVLAGMGITNPGVYYMLFVANHVVIGCGGVIDHDPAWVKSLKYNAPSNGWWTIGVITPA